MHFGKSAHALRVVTGTASLVLALSACSASIQVGGVDLTEIEAKLVELQEEATPDLSVGAATCPEDLDDIEVGDSFECTVEIEDATAPYTVTLESEEEGSDVGSFDFKPAKPIIQVSKVVDFLEGRLREDFADAEVDCGEATVLVTEVGGTFECTASDASGSETVEMVVKNVDGDVGFNQ